MSNCQLKFITKHEMPTFKTGWLVGWLVGWLAGWLVDWLTGWLAGWLVGRSVTGQSRMHQQFR
jgi:hypothetical protein